MSQKKFDKEQNRLVELYSDELFQEVIKKTRKLLKQNPTNIFLHNIQGASFMSLGKYGDAIESMHKILNIDPNYSDAYYNIGHTLNIMGKIEESILNYNKALEINPEYYEALFALGDIFHNLNQHQEAMINYAKVLQIKPDYFLAHYHIGNILLNTHRYEESISFYKYAIEIKPDYLEAYNNIGLAFNALNQYEDAIINYTKALDLNPNYAIAYNNLGNTLSYIKRYDDAILNYTKAIKIDSNYREAYNNLASALEEIGTFNEAVVNYKQAIKISSNYNEPVLNLIPMLIQLNKIKDIQELPKIKNNLMYKIYLSISTFIDEQFIETRSLLTQIENEINEATLSPLNMNDKKFLLAYFTFLDKLCSNSLKKEDSTPTKTEKNIIYHIGDSHSLSFAHQELSLENKIYTIETLIIFGAKAWHLGNNETNKYKAYFQNHINALEKGSHLILSFGEIDCRVDEGIISHYLKTGSNLYDIVYETVKGYIEYSEKKLYGLEIKRSYIGIPAPVIKDSDFSSNSNTPLRIEIVKLFNECLMTIASEKKLNIIDVYELTVNNQGISNAKYMCDDFHLDPLSLKDLKLNF